MEKIMHTPGPWTVEEYGDEDCPTLVIHHDDENRICFMATPGSHGDPAKIGANAYLIAAAPDLLDVLTKLANEVAGCWSAFEHELRCAMGNTNYQVMLDRLALAHAAIAKVGKESQASCK